MESAGFHAVVTNELSALSMDGYAMAAGGILVQVPDSDAEEARAFLHDSTPVDELPPDFPDDKAANGSE